MNCKVMGIVNVTPDSFSDGGRYYAPAEAVRRALNLAEEGADFLDLGGESTRPGAEPVGWEEEWRRLRPVLEDLARRTGLPPLSVDTYHPETARRALDAGASVVNCVYAGPAAELLALARTEFPSAGLVLPASVWDDPARADDLAAAAGRLWLDPMVGFGTTREEDLRLLRSVPDLARRGRVLVGASRKRIVRTLAGGRRTGKELGGSLAVAIWCARAGADVVRVHDVGETVRALRVTAALEEN